MNQTSADDLRNLLSNPQYWMNKAEALRAAAASVWHCRYTMSDEEMSEKLETDLTVNISGDTWQVYRMLCGMSLELSYKASFIAMGKKIIKTHNLELLAEQVCFQLSDKERGLLALLSECIVWEGRYPAPKDEQSLEYFVWLHYENLFRKVRTGNMVVLKPIEPDPLDWKSYNELWKTSVDAYNFHKS